MRQFLLNILSWVVVVCILADSAASFFYPKNTRRAEVVIDIHQDHLPSEGREEKNETLKVCRPVLVPTPSIANAPSMVPIETIIHLQTQAYLAVILPPPKRIG
jgi:hypothetical protein